MSSEQRAKDGTVFRSGMEIRGFRVGKREMAVPEENFAAARDISERQRAKYLKQGCVPLKDFAGFWADLSAVFTGPLAGYDRSVLKRMALPLMVPRGIGLSELPDSHAGCLVVLSAGNWHGIILCSHVNEQSDLLGDFRKSHNGDVVGGILRSNLEDILLIDVVSLLKHEGFLTVVK